jgi:hypothetical protein
MKMTNVCLLLSFITPLAAQSVTIDSWVNVVEADGSWQAGGDTIIDQDPACNYCGIELGVLTTVKENGVQVIQKFGSGTMDSASVEYDSPTIVNLGSVYDALSEHTWTDGVYSYDYFTETSVAVPGIPTITLNGVDASSPPFARWSYHTVPNGFQSLYSSTLIIGGLNAISYDKENPTFTFDQSQYPGLDCGPGTCAETTPVYFQGYLAGHFFYGPTSEVTVQLGRTVTDSHNSEVNESTEITGGLPTGLLTTHTATENFDFYTYDPFVLFTSLPEYVVHMNSAHSTMDTHSNICTPAGPAECDIAGIGEVNRWPFPPYPAVNNDPMPRVPIVIPPTYPDPNTLWAQQVSYYGVWLQEGTGFAVCNTLFAVENYAASFADLTPMGCIGLTLP